MGDIRENIVGVGTRGGGCGCVRVCQGVFQSISGCVGVCESVLPPGLLYQGSRVAVVLLVHRQIRSDKVRSSQDKTSRMVLEKMC